MLTSGKNVYVCIILDDSGGKAVHSVFRYYPALKCRNRHRSLPLLHIHHLSGSCQVRVDRTLEIGEIRVVHPGIRLQDGLAHGVGLRGTLELYTQTSPVLVQQLIRNDNLDFRGAVSTSDVT